MTVKEQLIAEAQALGIETAKLTIAQLKTALSKAEQKASPTDADAQSLSETIEDTPEQSSDEKDGTTEADQAAGDDDEKADYAKAGKRSQKQVLAAEAEIARKARAQKTSADGEKKGPGKAKIKPTRPRGERRAKKYKQVVKDIDLKQTFTTSEVLELVIQTSTTKFDSSVDMVIALGVDTKQADQNIRDFVVLPAGSGKQVRIAVFADDEESKKALEAGASVAGNEVFLQQLEKNIIDFDILIAMPHLMARLSKYAKLLGPKGLMPNPKSGTISKDVARAVKEALAGRVEYRIDERGLIHAPIGKVSFGPQKLNQNFEAIFQSIKNNRPANFKGIYIKSIYVSTTMGPGLRMAIPG